MGGGACAIVPVVAGACVGCGQAATTKARARTTERMSIAQTITEADTPIAAIV
jgi:hypothetical protein